MTQTFHYIYFTNETFDPSREYLPFTDGYRIGAHFKMAHAGEIDATTMPEALRALFEMFNIAHPADYSGRSMSVGDVVQLSNDYSQRAFACEKSGWTELPIEAIHGVNHDWTTMDVYFANQDLYELLRRKGRPSMFISVLEMKREFPQIFVETGP